MSYNDLTLKADEYIRLGGIPRTKDEWLDLLSKWATANENQSFIPHLGEYIFLQENNETIKYFVGDGKTTLEDALKDVEKWMTFKNGKITTDQILDKNVTFSKLSKDIVWKGTESQSNALEFTENGQLFVRPSDAGHADASLDAESSHPIANKAVAEAFDTIKQNSFGTKDESGNFKISDDIKNIESEELGKVITDKYFDKIQIENILVEQDVENNYPKDPIFKSIPLTENELYLYPNLKEIKGYVSLQCSKEFPVNLNRRWGFLNLPYGFFKCTIPMADNKIGRVVYGNIRVAIGSYMVEASAYTYATILDEKDQPCGIHIAFFLYSLDPSADQEGYYSIQIDPDKDALRLYIDIKYE